MKQIFKHLSSRAWLAVWAMLAVFAACSDDNPITPPDNPPGGGGDDPTEWTTVSPTPDTWDNNKRAGLTYQLLVYSFADSNGDGWGDLAGVTDKLDYLQQMGISALWLSPIHPAMSYHGYDVTDYTAIDPRLGTQADFDRLVSEAHKRNIRIYLDYVMNHTGKDHPWFLAAQASEDSPYRDYYTFSQDPASDIAAGLIPMIERNGYNAGEWFNVSSSDSEVSGRFKFTLDWSDAAHPTVTYNQWDGPADEDNPDNSTEGAKYIHYGDGINKKFYDRGNGIYELVVDFASNWGFLIRTSDTTWEGGTKYGASSMSDRITEGEPFALNNTTAANILFDSMKLWYYHSAFQTDWFADLNYGPVDQCATSPAYQAIASAARGWIERGVDGFRLDAVKHIYHNARSDENPTFLRTFYDDMNTTYHAQGHTDDLYMVGEVLSEHNEVAPYYAGLPALFEFSFWYRLEWAINNGTGRYFANDLLGYRQEYAAVRPDYIAATKLTNHDEDRAASLLGRNADKCRLAAAVLLTAQGSPYIYYGEELGLYGTKEKGDEYVRSPMLWGDSYTTAYTDNIDAGVASNVPSVSEQQADAASLLNTYQTFTRLRNTYPALATGTMSEHPTYNDSNANYNSLAAWYMTQDDQQMLVLHNFGNTAITLPLTDTVQKAVATQGTVEQSTQDDGTTQLRLGAYSSVVFLL